MSKCINDNLVKVQFVLIGENTETQTKQTGKEDLQVFRSKLSTNLKKKILEIIGYQPENYRKLEP